MTAPSTKPLPTLDPAPLHFDSALPCWLKSLLLLALTLLAYFFLDFRIAAWTLQNHPLDKGGLWHLKSDIIRELAMLEQWGQWVCTILIITAVALIDRQGKRRALSIALACLATVLVTYLLKDLCGRSRPDSTPAGIALGHWLWAGPAHGFTGGYKFASFPSAHTTGAFALSCSLAWFYPKARGLFMSLATITAAERILHSAHFLSDVLAGLALATFISRQTLKSQLAPRLLAALPKNLQTWWLQ